MAVLGFEEISGLSAAKALTIPAGTRFARVQAVTQNVRFRLDGTNPTSAIGQRIAVGETVELSNDMAMAAAKFIEETASAKLEVHYYG